MFFPSTGNRLFHHVIPADRTNSPKPTSKINSVLFMRTPTTVRLSSNPFCFHRSNKNFLAFHPIVRRIKTLRGSRVAPEKRLASCGASLPFYLCGN